MLGLARPISRVKFSWRGAGDPTILKESETRKIIFSSERTMESQEHARANS